MPDCQSRIDYGCYPLAAVVVVAAAAVVVGSPAVARLEDHVGFIDFKTLRAVTGVSAVVAAEDYKTLVKGMLDGTIVVSADIAAEPAVTNTTVEYLGNIK